MAKEVTKRFLACYELAKSNKQVRSAREFAKNIGCHPQSFHEIIKGRRDVTIDMLEGAISHYSFCTNYIFKNEGQPAVDSVVDDERTVLFPIILSKDHVAYCDDIESNTTAVIDKSVRISWLDLKIKNKIRAFQLNEVNPFLSLNPGDVFICSSFPKKQWKQNIVDGEVYIVVTKNSVVMRFVKNLIGHRDMLLLSTSDELDYSKQLYSTDEIKEIWQVEQKISTNVFISNKKNAIKDQNSDSIAQLKDLVTKQSEHINQLSKRLQTKQKYGSLQEAPMA